MKEKIRVFVPDAPRRINIEMAYISVEFLLYTQEEVDGFKADIASLTVEDFLAMQEAVRKL